MSEQPHNPQDSNEQQSQPQNVINVGGNYIGNVGNDYVQGSSYKTSFKFKLKQSVEKLFGQDLVAQSDRILGKLLPIVRTEVIGRLDDVLRQDSSLQVNHYLQLSFEDRGEAVGRDKRSKIIPLTPQTNLIEVFERQDVGRRLLILGDPGSGKTTSLLKLAAELLTLAKQDATQPIPVIFELSTWKDNHQSIEEWLIKQFKENYSVDFKISQQWLKQNRILPLLDGLDELGLMRQRLEIAKINEYLQQDFARQLVVCCRGEEYQQGEIKLYNLRGAYYLQPPTESDIRVYLEKLNQQDLWEKIEENPKMRELAKKPLFLNLMIVAFQGEAIVSESQLFSNYVAEQLSRPLDIKKYPQGKKPYSDENTKKWLTYLAGQLEADSLTVFYIEKMQPYWLNPGIERWLFVLIYSLIYGLALGWIFGLGVGSTHGLIFGLITVLILGLVLGLLWEFKEYKIKAEAFAFTWQGLKNGVIYALTYMPHVGMMLVLSYGLTYGLIFGLMFGLMAGLIINLNTEIKFRDKPNQGIKESVKKSLIISLLSSPFITLLFSLASPFADEKSSWIYYVSFLFIIWIGIPWLIGGQDLIQHLVLRIILWQQKLIPRNYANFLGYVEEIKLIHKIGGQYRFIHDLLRKYFANQALIPQRVIQVNSKYKKYLACFLFFSLAYTIVMIYN